MTRLRRAVWYLIAGVIAAALLGELRRPAAERAWHGRVGGIVPYDLRPPTLERARRTLWSPDRPRVLVPQAFGFGWTVNLGRIARLIGLA